MTALVRDALGVAHPRGGGAARIVSLVPSITELLIDLGLADRLVGRTGFCIHPRETVKRIPKVGGTKDVDIERVRALAPTHVIVNVDENRRETAAALGAFVPHVVATHPLGPRDNLDLYRLCGALFDREAAAEDLCARFEAAYARAEDAGSELPHEDVLYLIWKDPWMTVARDTYVSRTLALVGWHTVPRVAAARYPVVDLDAATLTGVARVLLSTEPYLFREPHVAEVARLASRPATLIDGEATSWYGSRAIAGLAQLVDFRRRLQREAV
jgi:ABC-type Fe3+-hydroxamate transport system substrate-binding protein